LSGRSLERVKAEALRVLEPLRSKYSAEMLAAAVDHILLHDPGRGKCVVPLSGLPDDLRRCLCLCSVYLQAEANRRSGTDNPVTFARVSPR
jgi:hypothetical protein